MKKINNLVDIQQKEGNELSKKLYRTVSDTAKKLDDARSCVLNISDLFIPPHLILRRKFCDYCERLIFSDPILFGRKSEELLWRKSFYEPVSSAKQLKKVNEFTELEILSLIGHINSGIGFYNHMITKLQYEYKIDLKNVVDFSVELDKENASTADVDVAVELLKWAEQSVHQCLIYIGDLYRYKSEIQPKIDSNLAVRHYLQAASYKPQYGMPHNQMGTLAMGQNKYLNAVYHYLRCLTCEIPFEGTSNNLQNLFDRNAQIVAKIPSNDNDKSEPTLESLEHLIVKFLSLIDILYYDKKETNDRIYDLCNEVSIDFGKCLKSGKNELLTSEMVFKMIVICLITISKLHTLNSERLPPLVAFTLSSYLQITKMVADEIEEGVINGPTVEFNKKNTGILSELMCNGSKKMQTKLRRRKIPVDDSDEEDSDVSGSEMSELNYTSSDDDSFSSDEDDNILDSSDDEDEADSTKDLSLNKMVKQSSKEKLTNLELAHKKVQTLNVKDMLDIVAPRNGLFQCIKILLDWLKTDEDLIKKCLLNNPVLISETLRLFNLLNINMNTTKSFMTNFKMTKLIADESQIPISEDIILKGTQLYKKDIAVDFNWNYTFNKQINEREESVIRIIKFISFAKYLTRIPEISVSFDKNNHIFVCNLLKSNHADSKANVEEMNQSPIISKIIRESKMPSKPPNGTNINKMKHMGQLWLESEVQALENKFGSNASRATLSPYLVLDADALIKHISMVKHLVQSRKFIVLIPEAVVSALDNLKKDQIEAREAIRWLELQFKKGNRFFRAQRPNEKATIPRIKYPKKKNREMQLYIQIIECCNFFAQQQKDATNVVTLLIGNQQILSSGDSKELSYVGLAETIGIVIDSIQSFYGKWKRNKGKR